MLVSAGVFFGETKHLGREKGPIFNQHPSGIKRDDQHRGRSIAALGFIWKASLPSSTAKKEKPQQSQHVDFEKGLRDLKKNGWKQLHKYVGIDGIEDVV